MTQDEKWIARYNEVVEFVETNHRNPSKHRIEEHNMLNWLKANRKLINAGALKPERIEAFKRLLELVEQYKRVNQFQYIFSTFSGAEKVPKRHSPNQGLLATGGTQEGADSPYERLIQFTCLPSRGLDT